MDFLAAMTMSASLLASSALSAAACRLVPQVFRLTPTKSWRRIALTLGVVLGFLIAPLSIVTFGWIGAGFAVAFFPAHWTPIVMTLTVPATVALGSAAASLLLVTLVMAVAAALRVLMRQNRCPPAR